MAAEQFVGASDHRLFADWDTWITEPRHVWTREFRVLAQRAVSLVSNDPYAMAQVNTKLRETHGPLGMSLRSAYSSRDVITGDTGERQKRREIEWLLQSSSAGTALDAGAELTRRAFDQQMDWIATVMGDAWAVWCWKPGRPDALLAGCWRIVTPDRVCNPDNGADSDTLYQGLRLDADGRVLGIHVQVGNVGAYGIVTNPRWQYVPLFNEVTGQRQVLHRVGLRMPGMLRGVSMFAPALLLLRQIQGTVESHVAAKRAQAIHPIVYQTSDEDELAAALTNKARLGVNAVLGPMSVLVSRYGQSDVKFPQSAFQGADLKDFLTTMYRTLSAMWGFPWQVVLASMGEASLASARAGLDQCDRTSQTYHADHVDQVSRPMDEAILREARARGEIDLPGEGWHWHTAGRYSRPPKYSTDRLKDANTVTALIATGVSPTTAFELFGLVYEDEAEQSARDREFALAQGLPDPLVDAPNTTRPTTVDPAELADSSAESVEPVADLEPVEAGNSDADQPPSEQVTA